MPLSWNNVNTHVASDVLPLADWNQAATALNSMVGTWVTSGTVASTGTNATPPFYCWFGSQTVTSNSSGVFTLTIPNGGFPNGIVFEIAANTTGAYNLNLLPSSASTKTTAQFNALAANTSAAFVGTFTPTFLIIGY
jgi:hypothetical protein